MGEKVTLKAVYELAQKNKGEDRLTQADIKQAKKVLNYKEPKKAADYGAIKDYAELSKGGGMDMGQMPNTVKPEPRGNPGIVETVVGKGGDYIKDLID
jgi:hypothetical protein